MRTIQGPHDPMQWTKGRIKEFFQRIEAHESPCPHCEHGFVDVTVVQTTHDHRDAVKCASCGGSGTERKLSVMVDAMMEKGATEREIRTWLSPFIEPDRRLGVIRYGGRVNIEMGVQGHTFEGQVTQMDVNPPQNLGHNGLRDYHVSLQVSEAEWTGERTSPGDLFLEENRCNDLHEFVDASTHGGVREQQCVNCAERRPLPVDVCTCRTSSQMLGLPPEPCGVPGHE